MVVLTLTPNASAGQNLEQCLLSHVGLCIYKHIRHHFPRKSNMSAVHCNPDTGLVVTQLFISLTCLEPRGVWDTQGMSARVPRLRPLLHTHGLWGPPVTPAGGWHFPPWERVTLNWLVATAFLSVIPAWSISCTSGFNSAPGPCCLHTGAGCDPIPWLGPECSGNFPSLTCPN